MKHLGDITKLKGSEVPLTEIVVGGSPCQDLSVAGKRKGLAGERSGLFAEQIRLIKEMRNESYKKLSMQGPVDSSRIIPRFMVWENVPGAFSSNGGEDFRAVLEETARVKDKDAVIPRLEGKQKWTPSGCIMGDGWSIAWRVHDAQFWGVPQRRKRIALVADFGGSSAPEILFERKGVSRDIEKSGKEREEVAGDAGAGIEETDMVASTITAAYGTKWNGNAGAYNGGNFVIQERYGNSETGRAISFQERAGKPGGGKGILIQNERTGALSTLNNQSVCCLNDQGGSIMGVSEDVTGALRAQEHGHQPLVFEPGAASRVGGHVYEDGKAGTVRANAGDNQQAVVYGISAYESNAMKSSNPNSGIYEAETARTLDLNGGSPACNQGGMAVVAIENHPNDSRVKISEDGMVQVLSSRMGTGGNNVPMVMESKDPQCVAYANEAYDKWSESEKSASLRASGGIYGGGSESLSVGSVVRRLTPLECERLQGFPDGWTAIGDWIDSKGKKHKGESDASRYKALGNSIALPFWEWMAERMVNQLKQDGFENPTMASLFDGIGGFPLVFSRNGCRPIWASEIEEFPIAVTKIRFPEDDK